MHEKGTVEKKGPEVTPSLPELPDIPPAQPEEPQPEAADNAEAAQPQDEAAAAATDTAQPAAADATAGSGATQASGDQQTADAATGASGAQAGDAATGASGNAASGDTDSSASASTGDTADHPDRTYYKDGFYMEPIDEDLKKRITGVSYPEDCPVNLDVLRHLGVRYIDFYDNEQEGEIICNERIAQDLLEIFYSLYTQRYPIESIRLVDDYDGDDTKSMVANNTSCFNYRTVEGSNNLSRHALGLAIDVNPLYNPWVNYNTDGTYTVSPEVSAEYVDRTADFAHKINEEDACYREFDKHNFFWGGHWNNPDYQHFQKN